MHPPVIDADTFTHTIEQMMAGQDSTSGDAVAAAATVRIADSNRRIARYQAASTPMATQPR